MTTSPTHNDDNYPSRSLGKVTIWPIGPESLAALIDIGLSDGQISAYFAVTVEDVLLLRNRHNLLLEHSDRFEITLNCGDKPTPCQVDFHTVEEVLCDMADGLTAANAYLVALRKINEDGKNDLYPDVVGRAADQVQRAGFAYRRLRKCLAPVLREHC